jgi:hypothetical protein
MVANTSGVPSGGTKRQRRVGKLLGRRKGPTGTKGRGSGGGSPAGTICATCTAPRQSCRLRCGAMPNRSAQPAITWFWRRLSASAMLAVRRCLPVGGGLERPVEKGQGHARRRVDRHRAGEADERQAKRPGKEIAGRLHLVADDRVGAECLSCASAVAQLIGQRRAVGDGAKGRDQPARLFRREHLADIWIAGAQGNVVDRDVAGPRPKLQR